MFCRCFKRRKNFFRAKYWKRYSHIRQLCQLSNGIGGSLFWCMGVSCGLTRLHRPAESNSWVAVFTSIFSYTDVHKTRSRTTEINEKMRAHLKHFAGVVKRKHECPVERPTRLVSASRYRRALWCCRWDALLCYPFEGHRMASICLLHIAEPLVPAAVYGESWRLVISPHHLPLTSPALALRGQTPLATAEFRIVRVNASW